MQENRIVQEFDSKEEADQFCAICNECTQDNGVYLVEEALVAK